MCFLFLSRFFQFAGFTSLVRQLGVRGAGGQRSQCYVDSCVVLGAVSNRRSSQRLVQVSLRCISLR